MAHPPPRRARTARARSLRREGSEAERRLRAHLANRCLQGLKFRRQHPEPPFVLDFYCHEARLAVEVDGGHHGEPEGRQHDRARDRMLASRAILVLRFWANQTLQETEAVLETIRRTAMQRKDALRSGIPSPRGERGHWGSVFGPGGPCRQVIAIGLPIEPVPPLIGSGANT